MNNKPNLALWQRISDNFNKRDAEAIARYEAMKAYRPTYATKQLAQHEEQRARIARMLAEAKS